MSQSQTRSVLSNVRVSFRERALAEAARYGSDSWVFLRELLQNGRDAGARHVTFEVTQDGDKERLVCRDDGCGMSAVHAHRYLFALYASSKEGDTRQAGQFGVGFWSVLRFKPERVVIRSRPRHGDAWQVELSHRLENAVFTSCEMETGTEIVLERRRKRQRPPRPELLATRPSRPLADKVFDAVYRYARFLTCRVPSRGFLTRCVPSRGFLTRRHLRPLLVTVNGRPANVDMTLPPPSSTFRRRGFRGVVALGEEPRVELFANGLLVRQAACLEDLLDDKAGDRDTRSSLDLPGSLAPQVVLDSEKLELLLARSDVRQTRHLESLVKIADKELERLIEHQLDALRPQSFLVVLWARCREAANRLAAFRGRRPAWWLVALALAGVLSGWVLAGFLSNRAGGAPWSLLDLPSSWRGAASRAGSPQRGDLRGGYLEDLGESYLGPRLDPLSHATGRLRLTYRPAGESLFLRALVVEDPSSWSASANKKPVPTGLYEGRRCKTAGSRTGEGCVTIRLPVSKGDLRIPVPTGHLVDPESVRVNGEPNTVYVTAGGEPLLLHQEAGDLEYRTGPAMSSSSYLPPPLASSPAVLTRLAAGLAQLPVKRRLDEALDLVAQRVAYDRSEQAVEQYHAALEAGLTFAEAALRVGKGDCDIQNGVLVLLLREAGLTARLAVGFVGRRGQVAPGLHAWVEYLDAARRWQVADVSASFTPAGTSPLRWVTGARGPLGSLAGDMSFGLPAAEGGADGWANLSSLFSTAGLQRTARRLAVPVSVLVALVLTSVLTLVLVRSGSAVGNLRLAHTDLAALLGGALQHPGLSRLPALLHGRFIPLIESSGSASAWRWKRSTAMSLHEAKQRSEAGTLFCSAGGSQLARVAAERGWPIIDASRKEGRVTSLGLGAVDLDEWSDLLDRETSSALVRYMNEYLDSIGEDWRLVLVSPLSQPLKVIDLARLGLGRRQVLIDPRSADFAPYGPRLELAGDSAAFRLLDVVADHLDLERSQRARLLTELARRAVLEEHGEEHGEEHEEHGR